MSSLAMGQNSLLLNLTPCSNQKWLDDFLICFQDFSLDIKPFFSCLNSLSFPVEVTMMLQKPLKALLSK